MYVVSVRLLAKLWDNEFSWNHDRTYLRQVMVSIFFSFCGSGSQSGALCKTGYLSETYLKLKPSEVSFAHSLNHIDSISFLNVLHCTTVVLTWSAQNIKNVWRLKGMLSWTNEIFRVLSLRWVSDGYPPTLDSPIGDRFFQLCRATLKVWHNQGYAILGPFKRTFVSHRLRWTIIITQSILAHFGKVQNSLKRLYLTTCMVTGTTVPVVCYRSFWFGTGTSDVRYRNIARRERYVTETSSKFHTPLLRFIGHRPIHKSRIKARYDRTVCTPNIAALRHVVW